MRASTVTRPSTRASPSTPRGRTRIPRYRRRGRGRGVGPPPAWTRGVPGSAFGVKEPVPRWPFYLLIGLAALFLVFAFLFWVEENPGSYPRVDAWWARTRGRLVRTIAPLRRRSPPKA